jgi:hypothetical protein
MSAVLLHILHLVVQVMKISLSQMVKFGNVRMYEQARFGMASVHLPTVRGRAVIVMSE